MSSGYIDLPVSGGGSGGTVTSVAMTVPSFLSVSGSPITTSGTLAVTLSTETANTVFAGPTSGGATTPTFRTLVSGDIPSLSGTYLPLAGGTMSGAIAMGTNNITGIGVLTVGSTLWTIDTNGILTHTPGTLSSGNPSAHILNFTHSSSATTQGLFITATGNGSSTISFQSSRFTLASGYSGAGRATVMLMRNQSTGTGNDLYGGLGNQGLNITMDGSNTNGSRTGYITVVSNAKFAYGNALFIDTTPVGGSGRNLGSWVEFHPGNGSTDVVGGVYSHATTSFGTPPTSSAHYLARNDSGSIDFQNYLNSSGTSLFKVDSNGSVTGAPTALSGAFVYGIQETVTLHATSASNGILVAATGAGSAANISTAGKFTLAAGKTSGANHGVYGSTAGLSTGFNVASLFGNYGGVFEATGANTTGWNVAAVGKTTNAKQGIGVLGLSASPQQASGVSIGVAGVANYTNLNGILAAAYLRLDDTYTSAEFTPSGSGVLVLDTETGAGSTALINAFVNADPRFVVGVDGSISIGGGSGSGNLTGNNSGTISGFASLTGLTSLNVGGAINATTTVVSYGSSCVVVRFANDSTVSTDDSGNPNNLNLYNFPANSFVGNANHLSIWASGKLLGDGESKTIAYALAGTPVISYTTATADDMFYSIDITIKQRATGDQRYRALLTASQSDGSGAVTIVRSGTLALDTTADISLSPVGTGTSNSDQITNDVHVVEQGFFVVPD